LGDDGGTRRRKKPTSEEVGGWGVALPDKPDRADSRKEQNLTCNDTKEKGIQRRKRI
jgi:hypothetical protein